MQKFHNRAGYSLVEIMTVVAIAGILGTIGVATLRSYSRHEEARSAATTVAGVLQTARTQAMALGNMSFVLFAQPLDGSVVFAPDQYAALVIDSNGSQNVDAADSITPIFLPGNNPDITSYGAHGPTPLEATALPDADESQSVIFGDLSNLVEGTTLNVDPFLGVPVIAFSTQGAPVTVQDPENWGGGAGAVYLTDNSQMLIAVVVLPLGDVRTMAWDANSNEWK